MNQSRTPNRNVSVKRLGLALIAAIGALAAVAAAHDASAGPVGPDLSDRITLSVVEGATDLSFSGLVDGEVRHAESLDGLTSTELATEVIDWLEGLGCQEAGSIHGHGLPIGGDRSSVNTTIARQFDCGGPFAEVGWTTDELGVDLVVGEPSPVLAEE